MNRSMNALRTYATQPARAARSADQLSRAAMKYKVLPNGTVIVALENLSPITRIGVFLRAGSRFEKSDELGLTHTIRYAAGMATQNASIFGITRNIDHTGGSLSASTTRDNMIYRLDGMRNTVSANFDYLAETISRPAFKYWQLEDYSYRMDVELKRAHHDPQTVLLEELHRISYRGGLSNPIYCPDHMVGKHDTETLLAYVKKHYCTGKMSVVGIGVELEELIEAVTKNIDITPGKGPEIPKSKFTGGESRIHLPGDTSYAVVATEAISSAKSNELLASYLFQHMLHAGQKVKYSKGASPLIAAAEKVAKEPFNVDILNISYCDSGLFGLVAAAKNEEIQAVMKAAVGKMREAAKNINDQELAKAKSKFKAALNLFCEDPDNLLCIWGNQALDNGQVLDVPELEKMVDSVSLSDVQNVAAKLMKAKGSLVYLGNLDNAVALEDLI